MELQLGLLVLVVLFGGGCLAISRELFPCDNQTANFNVSLYSSDTITVHADLNLCNYSWNVDQYNVSNSYCYLMSAA